MKNQVTYAAAAIVACALAANAAWQPGLLGGWVNNYASNNSNWITVEEPDARSGWVPYPGPHAATNRVGTSTASTACPPIWANDRTWIYKGQMFLSKGTHWFCGQIDDARYMAIDGVKCMESTSYSACVVSSPGYTVTSDNGEWVDIEIRLANGTGGAGYNNNVKDANGLLCGFGHAVSDTAPAAKMSNFAYPCDPGDMSVFRYDDGNGFPNQVEITGEPWNVAVPGVTYGFCDLTEGAVSISAPSGARAVSEGVRATCVGWRLYSVDTATGEETAISSNTTATATFTHADGSSWRLSWQWSVEYMVTAESAAAGCAVSPAEQWVPLGGTAAVSATPGAGAAFARWTGDVPANAKYDNPLVLGDVSAPLALEAAFVEPGAVRHWTGAGDDALASNPANWLENAAPADLDAVVFDAGGNGHDCTWDLDVPLQSWTQDGYTNRVTIQTVYDDSAFYSLRIIGDCLLASGSWTHLPNPGNANVYRLKADVGGDMTIGPDAAIDVSGMGYMAHYAPFGVPKTSANEGASYGGRGFPNGSTATEPYGCYYAPEDPGNCGTWNTPSIREGAGGGVLTLTVGGSLVHNGQVVANAGTPKSSHYAGSGGSVYIVAGTIAGSGSIAARAASANFCGAGGRIAMRLTAPGADFADYDLVSLADATPPRTGNHGASGTIYGETAADARGEGWLILKGNGTIQSLTSCYPTPFTKEVSSVALARLTLTNNVLLLLNAGNTLDISRAEVIADDTSVRNGIYVDGGALVIDPDAQEITCAVKARTPMAFGTGTLTIGRNGNLWSYGAGIDVSDDLIVANAGRVTSDHGITVGGDATVLSGGTVTTTGPQSVPDHELVFTVAGDLAIAEGGAVTASGKGYSASYGPVVNGSNTGSSHGGWGHGGAGTCTVPPYGSALDPRTHGAAGSAGSGGGVVLLSVSGALRNDGTISADGVLGSGHYGAAGGSVNITAASLTGAASGVISASAEATMHCNSCSKGVSGGGRVAVVLTGAASGFDGYEGVFKARGSRWDASSAAGGAGTIYLRKGGEAIGEGRLVVDNDGASKSYETVLGGGVECPAVGSFENAGGANTVLAEGAVMSVSRGWANQATFAAGEGSEVHFVGEDDFAYSGSTTFASVEAAVPGKRVVFADGSTLAATGQASLAGGSAAKLVLDSADAASTWTLDAPNAILSDLEVNGCQSVTEVFVANGFGERNNENVVFGQVDVGASNVWTGAVSSDWSASGNWESGRVPIATDVAVVPAGAARWPSLSASATVAGLQVAGSARLAFGGKTLTVAGAATLAGALDFTSGGVLAARGDIALTGSADGSGTLRLESQGAQCAGISNATFAVVEILSASVALSGSVEAATLRVGDGSRAVAVAFADGTSVKATDFVVAGDTNAAPVALSCAAAGGTWLLNAVSASVAGALVSGSDASSGALVVPSASVDRGGNVNWLFNDTRARWTGAVDGDFATAGNWASGAVPGAGDDVLVSGAGAAVSVAAPVAIRSLAVEDGASVAVKARLDVDGSVSVGNGATLAWDVPGAINGNLAVLSGGTLTHSGNTTQEASKLDLAVAGGGYVALGGSVNVSGKGYSYSGNRASGPGGGTANNSGNTGASYGGRGYGGAGGVGKPCYGSYLCPTNCGSSGSWVDGGAGGGAIRLAFGDALIVDGEIAADGGRGGSYYTGSGGSIWLAAASLGGNGAIHATGSPTGNNSCFGGGGRIAIYTCTPDDIADTFGGTVLAHGGYLYTTGRGINGSAGTVYLQNGADKPGWGTVRIANRNGITNRDTAKDKTDLPSPSLCDPAEARNAFFLVEEYGTLNLTADTQISDLQMDATGRLQLNGFTLTIRSRKHDISGTVVEGGTAENPGKIVWLRRDAPSFLFVH